MSYWEKAEALYSKIVELDSSVVDAWINLSESVLPNEGTEGAIDVIERALENNKDQAALWYRLAGYLYRSGKVQQAYFFIETAMKLDVEKIEFLLEYLPELNNEPRFIELLTLYKSTGD